MAGIGVIYGPGGWHQVPAVTNSRHTPGVEGAHCVSSRRTPLRVRAHSFNCTVSASNSTQITPHILPPFITVEIPFETVPLCSKEWTCLSKMTMATMARINLIEMGLIRGEKLRQKGPLFLALPCGAVGNPFGNFPIDGPLMWTYPNTAMTYRYVLVRY